MPNKREVVVIIYYIVPIHLLLSLLIIYNIGGVFFSYFLFGIWRFWRIFFCCVPCVLQYHMLVPSSQLRCTHRRNYDEWHNVITLVEVVFFSYWKEEKSIRLSLKKQRLFLFFSQKSRTFVTDKH